MPQKMFGAGAVDLHTANRVCGFKIVCRLFCEFCMARCGAEMKHPSAMRGRQFASIRVHNHSANGIAYNRIQWRLRSSAAGVIMMMAMIVFHDAAFG